MKLKRNVVLLYLSLSVTLFSQFFQPSLTQGGNLKIIVEFQVLDEDFSKPLEKALLSVDYNDIMFNQFLGNKYDLGKELQGVPLINLKMVKENLLLHPKDYFINYKSISTFEPQIKTLGLLLLDHSDDACRIIVRKSQSKSSIEAHIFFCVTDLSADQNAENMLLKLSAAVEANYAQAMRSSDLVNIPLPAYQTKIKVSFAQLGKETELRNGCLTFLNNAFFITRDCENIFSNIGGSQYRFIPDCFLENPYELKLSYKPHAGCCLKYNYEFGRSTQEYVICSQKEGNDRCILQARSLFKNFKYRCLLQKGNFTEMSKLLSYDERLDLNLETRMAVPEIRNLVSDVKESGSNQKNNLPTPEEFFKPSEVQKGLKATSAESIAKNLLNKIDELSKSEEKIKNDFTFDATKRMINSTEQKTGLPNNISSNLEQTVDNVRIPLPSEQPSEKPKAAENLQPIVGTSSAGLPQASAAPEVNSQNDWSASEVKDNLSRNTVHLNEKEKKEAQEILKVDPKSKFNDFDEKGPSEFLDSVKKLLPEKSLEQDLKKNEAHKLDEKSFIKENSDGSYVFVDTESKAKVVFKKKAGEKLDLAALSKNGLSEIKKLYEILEDNTVKPISAVSSQDLSKLSAKLDEGMANLKYGNFGKDVRRAGSVKTPKTGVKISKDLEQKSDRTSDISAIKDISGSLQSNMIGTGNQKQGPSNSDTENPEPASATTGKTIVLKSAAQQQESKDSSNLKKGKLLLSKSGTINQEQSTTIRKQAQSAPSDNLQINNLNVLTRRGSSSDMDIKSFDKITVDDVIHRDKTGTYHSVVIEISPQTGRRLLPRALILEINNDDSCERKSKR